MDARTVAFELLMAGFFAVACIRAHGPIEPGETTKLSNLLLLSDRLERLRHTRWQWCSMVGLLLLIRLQQPIPFALEIMVAAQFALFMALPERSQAKKRVRAR